MAMPEIVPRLDAAEEPAEETVELVSVAALAAWLGQREEDVRSVIARGELGRTVQVVLPDGDVAGAAVRTGAPARTGATVGPGTWVWRPSLPGTITAHLLAPGGDARARTRCGRDEAARDRFEPAPALLRRCRVCRQRAEG